MEILQRIQVLIDRNNTSASKMSKDLGFSSGLFSQWKSGKQKPSAEKLILIANYFNVSTDYLLNNEDKKISLPSENDKLNDEKLTWINKISQLSAEDKNRLESLVDLLLLEQGKNK